MTDEESRAAFQSHVWTYYAGLKAAGWSHPEEGDSSNPESLFWRTPSGKYGVAQIEAAWCGWQMHECFTTSSA